jgi:hypothetical protein
MSRGPVVCAMDPPSRDQQLPCLMGETDRIIP